jgi:hypothetical protein
MVATDETFVATPHLTPHLFPMNRRCLLIFPLLTIGLGGCLSVKTEPIEVKPIHVTVDVNVKVDRALDDVFGDLDKKSSTISNPKS